MSHFPRQRFHAPRGFTLVELVVVITVIAILAGAVLPSLISPYMRERRAQTMREMSAIAEGILGQPNDGHWGYLSHIGALPDSLDKLLLRPGSWTPGAPLEGVQRGWSGPYVQNPTTGPTNDPWGSPYVIVTNASDPSRWQLHSYGPNRVPGPAGANDDDFILPSLTGWYGSKGNVRVTLVHARDGALAPVNPAWVTAVTLQVPDNNGSSHQSVACGGTEGPSVCEFADVPLGLHSVRIDLHPDTECVAGVNCTIFRQVKVLKPLNAVEVVLPNPPDYRETVCGLPNLFTTTIANGDCGVSYTVPPGGHFTVTVSGALERVSGSDRCMIAPQIENLSTSTRWPDNDLTEVVHPSSLPVTSQSNAMSPAFTTRTFVNTNTMAVNLRGAVVLAADLGTDCQFNEGKLTLRLWMP